MVLLTPNGLPQRMQQNGCSSLRTRARGRGGAEVELRLQRDDLLGAGRLAQPALHAGVLGEAQHRPLGIVGERAGRAGRDAGEAQRAAGDVDLHRSERRALGQRHHIDRRRRGAVQLAQRDTQHAALGAGRQEARRARRRTACGAIARSAAPSASGSSVSMVATRPPPKPRPRRIGSASAMVRVKPGDVVARPRAQQEAHRRGAVGEGRGDGLEAHLRHLVDGERQHVGGQAVAEARQRIDQRRAVRIVVQQHDRALAAGIAIGGQQRAQLAHQGIGRRQRIGRRAGRADGGALAAAGADLGVDRHVVAGRRDGAGRDTDRGSACSRRCASANARTGRRVKAM